MFLLSVLLTIFNSYFFPIKENIIKAPRIEIANIELKKEVYAVAGEVLQVPKKNLIIKQHSFDQDIAESGSESEIFYVYDAEEKPLAVMKKESINPQFYSEHEYEYVMLDSINHMAFNHFHAVKLYGVFEGPELGEQLTTSGYIIESVANGKSLNGYVKEIGSEKDAVKRSALLKTLIEGVEKTALGLGELHNKKHFSKPTEYYVKRFHEQEKDAQFKIAKTLPGPYGLIHGDLHLGNIFYDEASKQATFIDFSSAYHSQKGGPVAQDLANFILATEMLGSYHGLTHQEIEEIKDAFLKSYKKTGPDVDSNSIEIYRKYFLLVYTQDVSNWDKNQKEQAEYIYAFCKSELESASASV